MHRRRLLRSLTWASLGVAAAACGTRSGTPTPSRSGDGRKGAGEGAGEPTAEQPPAEPGDDDVPTDAEDQDGLATGPRVEVLCRDAIDLRPAQDTSARHVLDRLTLHHSAVALAAAARAPQQLRAHQRHHQEQGWSDIAYHYAVDLAGNVYELRDPAVPGDTFTDYDTTGHLHVVGEGDFEEQQPTDELLEGVAALLAALAAEHDLDPAALETHRTYVSTTACPGQHLQAQLATLRSEAARRLDPAPRLDLRCDAAARERVAAIEAG